MSLRADWHKFIDMPLALQPAVADLFGFFARDWMTVPVVAAFFRIPEMSSGGAIEQQHHRRSQHAKMLRHL